ncbi:PaaI family thioesterase [Micromonospora sonneratiae]|uniref:Acyl-coenzyme A thioesterase THEM4 n=1 Tax=Micromonospora sonneratiae TaxID=1184706 RepID=A0ABW3Y5G2_9ACTN
MGDVVRAGERAANGGPGQVPGSDWDPADHRDRADLVEATRRLMSAVALTDVTPDELRWAAERVERITDLLTTATRPRCLRFPLPTAPFQGRVQGSADPVLGLFNPLAVPMAVTIGADGTASGTLTPGPLFEGPPELVHGGYSALLLDGIMGTLVRALGITAMTGTLTLRYLAPTPLEQPLELSAWVSSRHGRKTTVEGRLSAGGTPTVLGTGIFVSPPEPV